MLHLPTLLFALVLTHLVLAVTLWVASSRESRAGLPEWVAALGLQAVTFIFFALRMADPLPGTFVGANASTGLAFALQIAALRRLEGRTLAPAWLVVAPALCGLPLLAFETQRHRVIFGGLVFGIALFSVALTAQRLHEPGSRRGVRMLVAGAALGGLVAWGRAVLAALRPEVFHGFVGEGAVPVGSVLLLQVFTLAMSLGFLLIHRDRRELAMERLAMTDSLTGTLNRRALFDVGSVALARARAEGAGFAVLLLDLDAFKQVNDEHGHAAGDEVLRRFAGIVRGCLRATDLLARYGGEEFCVLLPGTTEAGARAIAERIRAAVEATPVTAGPQPVPVTTSLGLASTGDASEDLSKLLRRADAALYRAKHEGRNRVVVAAAA